MPIGEPGRIRYTITVIIDWEYAGNNDPLWDLAAMSLENEFDMDQESFMVQAYFDNPKKSIRYKMDLYKICCDVLWALWGLYISNKRNDNTYKQYGINRSNRAQESIAQKIRT